MNLVLIFRSKRLRYHSIENVFNSLHSELSQHANVEIMHVEKRGFSITNMLFARKYAIARKDSIFHVTGDIHYIVFALPRKRTILTIHDCVFIKKRKGLKGWILKKLYLDWPVRYVPVVTAISEKTKNEVISLTGCKSGKIQVVNNPVSDLIRCKDKVFNNDKPLLLFIGSLPNKNLNRVIEAIRGFSCTLNIVGYASESQQLRMKEYGIEYIVERNISNEDIGQRYEAADIVLFPSLYEGFGLPVIEGFKAGRAVLTSDISPLKELSDGAAWLVDPYNAESIRNTLERIVRDDEARNRKIQAGLAIVKNFSPDRISSSYLQAYSDLQLRRFLVLVSVVQYLL
jgi:glycosyltransferase involved in cell wall biosynthesis